MIIPLILNHLGAVLLVLLGLVAALGFILTHAILDWRRK